MASTSIDSARERRRMSPKMARESAAEFHGFLPSVEIEIGEEVFEVPNPSLLDDDQQERFNDLNAEIEATCDHEDDIEIAERTLDDGTVLPARTLKGDLKNPYTIEGKPLKPPYNTRLAKVLFGEDGYARFKAGGGRSNQIALIWGQMDKEYEARKKVDPKSLGSGETPASLPDGDRVGLVSVSPPADS